MSTVAWSTLGPHAIGAERFVAVSSGRSFAQVAGAVLRKQARVQNPDKDEVQVKAGGCKPEWVALVPAALAAVTSPRVLCGGGWTYVRPKMSTMAMVKPGKATRVISARATPPSTSSRRPCQAATTEGIRLASTTSTPTMISTRATDGPGSTS